MMTLVTWGLTNLWVCEREILLAPNEGRCGKILPDMCQMCKRKTLPKRVAPLSHLSSSGPMDLVCMDFLSIEPDSKKHL